MQRQVLNNTKGIIGLPNSKIDLMPGSNFVDAKKVESDEKHAVVKTWVKKGLITFKGEVESSKSEGDDTNQDGVNYPLASMNVGDATEVIEQTFDVAELEAWRDAEEDGKARKGILKAIDTQLEEIENQEVPNDEE